jgi:hypothetical protein
MTNYFVVMHQNMTPMVKALFSALNIYDIQTQVGRRIFQKYVHSWVTLLRARMVLLATSINCRYSSAPSIRHCSNKTLIASLVDGTHNHAKITNLPSQYASVEKV